MKLHIIRDGLELGALTETETLELLETGFLKPTDEFWSAQAEDKRPLSALIQTTPKQQANLLSRAVSSATTVGQVVQSQATNLTKKLSGVVQRQQSAIANSTTRAMEDYLPHLRTLVIERLGKMVGATESALNDEVFLRKLFGAVYDCLPKPVSRFVNEASFVEFCLKHKRQLLK